MAVSIPAVYEEVKRQIGKTVRFRVGTIERRDFQRFAIASGDCNPLFFDDDFARAAGHPSAIAPPLYLSSVLGWEPGPPQESLRPDGTTGQETPSMPLGGLRLMGGGQEIEFHRPVTDGMEVTMEVGAEAVELKHGRSGDLVVITLARKYFDHNEQLLAVSRETFIAR